MKLNKWFYLAALSFIWGSSFILIKKGLIGLTAIELGSIRIIISAFVLIPFTFNRLKEITFKQWKWIIISAFVGSFFPAFLFAFAEQEIDSSVASILNSIVPLNTIIIGLVLFGIKSTKRQIIGVLLGFFGAYQLIISGMNLNPDQNYFYSGLVIICSFLYAFKPELKSFKFIPDAFLAAKLNIFEGIFLKIKESYLLFFHPDIISNFSLIILL